MTNGKDKVSVDVGLLSRLAGLVVVLFTAATWASGLSSQLTYMALEITEIKAELQSIKLGTKDRWSRTQHDAWVKEEFRPLEDRVRALEAK